MVPRASVLTEQLIDARCNFDPQIKDGSTPIYIAAQQGHASVTEQLIAACCILQRAATSIFRRRMASLRIKLLSATPELPSRYGAQSKKGADRAMKDVLRQASPEKTKQQQEEA